MGSRRAKSVFQGVDAPRTGDAGGIQIEADRYALSPLGPEAQGSRTGGQYPAMGHTRGKVRDMVAA